MVRTFLVALRASTAIAVQICANLLSVGLSCVRALVKTAKSATPFERTQQKIFFVSREVWSSSAVSPPKFARQIIFSC